MSAAAAELTRSPQCSPTFNDQIFAQRGVAVQEERARRSGWPSDSATNVSMNNTAYPSLKDIPILGNAPGGFDPSNRRFFARTELLCADTPHVVHDQRDARGRERDLRNQLDQRPALSRNILAAPGPRARGWSGTRNKPNPVHARRFFFRQESAEMQSGSGGFSR